MSRWALFATHGSRRAGASVPRRFGADGRELQRPWRIPTSQVELQVQQVRAMRRQPVWPRVLGMLLLGVAGVAALHPVDPVARHVAGSASARTVPVPLRLRLESPAGPLDEPPVTFHWSGARASAVHTLVFCDASYTEVARADGIVGASWQVTPAVAALFADGGTFHWFALGGDTRAPARSTFESFTIERRPNVR